MSLLTYQLKLLCDDTIRRKLIHTKYIFVLFIYMCVCVCVCIHIYIPGEWLAQFSTFKFFISMLMLLTKGKLKEWISRSCIKIPKLMRPEICSKIKLWNFFSFFFPLSLSPFVLQSFLLSFLPPTTPSCLS